MYNSVYWQRIHKQEKLDAEADRINDFLMKSSWDEVRQRPDIINSILDPNGSLPADRLEHSRAGLIGILVSDIQKIPPEEFDDILLRFARTNLQSELNTFQKYIEDHYPGVKVSPKEDLVYLHNETNNLLNGLKNIQNIGFLKTAEELFTDISILKKLPSSQISQLSDKIKKIDEGIAVTIKNKENVNKQQLIELTDVLRASGRVDLQIDDLKDDLSKLIDVLISLIRSLAIVRQAQKAGTLDKLNSIDGIVEILQSIQEERVEKFFQTQNAKT